VPGKLEKVLMMMKMVRKKKQRKDGMKKGNE
jgi:hypothetical protein